MDNKKRYGVNGEGNQAAKLGVLAHLWQDTATRKQAAAAPRLLARVPLAQLLAVTLAGVSSAAVASSNIVANGRTNTQVTGTGIISVTTDTIRGNNALNAFSHFTVDASDTVNLHLPGSTRNLINLVDSKIQVDGTVNSLYPSGQLGGNVFFASPQGFVVGQSGVINVGSLTVATPTTQYIEQFLDGTDQDVAARVLSLQDGTAPASDGVISIEGRVNALEHVTLRGATIDVAGGIYAGDQARDHIALNLAGAATGVALVQDGDRIMLVAQDQISVSGSVIANRREQGQILIAAIKEVEVDAGTATAAATVDIAGTVSGGNIVVKAEAKATAKYDGEAADSAFVSDATALADVLEDVADLAKGELELGLVQAKADARVVIHETAKLDASEELTLSAKAERSATTPAIAAKGESEEDAFVIAAVLGSVSGTTSVEVAGGAQLKVGGDFTAKAESVNTVDIQATSTTAAADSYVAATLAYGHADVTTKVQIARGADIEAANVRISARNDNEFSVQSTAKAVGEAAIGAAVAVTDFTTTADAQLAAFLDAGAVSGNLLIDAQSHTSKNFVKATTATGAKASESKTKKITTAAGKLGDFVNKKQQKSQDKVDEAADKDAAGGEEKTATELKLASALALSMNQHGAKGSIAADTTVNVGGNVAVVAKVKDEGIRNIATSNVATQKDKPGDGRVTGSAAIAIGLYEHNAEATIGKGASVEAERIGVDATVELPLTVSWLKWESSESFLDNLKSNIDGKTNDTLGIPEQVLTTYANATGAAEGLGFAGAVSYFQAENNARAWVGDNATLSSRATPASAEAARWQTALSDDLTIDWEDVVSIRALSQTESINVAGNFKLTGLGTSGDKGAASVGGAFNWVNYDNSAQAGIGAGATIDTDGLALKANSQDWVLAFSPTSGGGTSIAGNAILALTQIDNLTHASISHDATVRAKRLQLDALQEFSALSIAGAFVSSEAVAGAAGLAFNDVRADTRAFIGDNSDAETPKAAGAGRVETDALQLEATTDGQVISLAVAGAVAKSSDPKPEAEPDPDKKPGFIAKKKEQLQGKVKELQAKGQEKLDKLPLVGSLVGSLSKKEAGQDNAPPAQEEPTKPKVGLSAAGSVTGTISQLDTQAYVEGVTIGAYTADGKVDAVVRAKNDTDLIGAAGAAAFTKANKESVEYSAAVAGAAAFNVILNDTYAGLRGVTMHNAGKVSVQALSAGDSIAIGIAPAINASKGDSSASVAGSASLSWIANSTVAEIEASTLYGTGVGDLDVTAYDRSRTINGGGAVNAGGKYGLGVALSVAHVGNTAAAAIKGGTIRGFDEVGVSALSSSRLISAAATGGGSKDGTHLVGSFVFNDVANTVYAGISGGANVTARGDVRVLASGTNGEAALDAELGARRDLADYTLDRGEAPEPEGEDDAIADARFGEDTGGELIIGVAGAVGVGDNAAGLSFVGNVVRNSYLAVIEEANVVSDSLVSVKAQDSVQIIGVAAGVAVGKKTFAGMGSGVANVVTSNVTARVGAAGKNRTHITANGLDVIAHDAAELWAGAGSVAASKGKAAVGASVAFNATIDVDAVDFDADDFDSDKQAGAAKRGTGATIDNATINLDGGTLTVDAYTDSAIRAIAIAGTGSSEVAIGGSLTFNIINDAVTSSIQGSTINAGSASVVARDRASIWSLAGNVVGSSGKAAIGAAIAVNTIANRIAATVDDSTLTIGGSTTVGADTGSEIYSIAVAGGGAEGVAAGISSTINTITKSTAATVKNSTISDGDDSGSLTVRASDRKADGGNGSVIWSLAGNVQGAGKAAAGLAASVNNIVNELVAETIGSTVTLDGAVSINADSGAEIKSAAVAGGGAGKAAVMGAATLNHIINSTTARLAGGKVSAADLTVHASERNDAAGARTSIWSLAGNAGGAGTASVGASLAENLVTNTVLAEIAGGTHSVSGDTQVKTDSGAEIISIAVGGSGSGKATVGASVTVNTIVNSAMARVVNATLDDGSGNAGSLSVTASDRLADDAKGIDLTNSGTKIWSLAGNVGGAGAAAVGGAAAVNTVANTLAAEVVGSTIDVGGAVKVDADSATEIKTAAVAGGGAGKAAVMGSTAVSTIANTVRAKVSGGTLKAGSLDVRAAERDDASGNRSSIMALAGNAQGAGAAAVGAAVVVNTIINSLNAEVANVSDLVVHGDTTIAADSGAEIYSAAVGGGGAGGAAVGASLVANTIARSATATLVNSTLSDGAGNAGNLTVRAHDRFADGTNGSRIWSLAGNVQGAGTAAVGGAMAINTITNAAAARTAADDISADDIRALAQGDQGPDEGEPAEFQLDGLYDRFEGGDEPTETQWSAADAGSSSLLAARIIDSDIDIGGQVRVDTDSGSEIKSAAVAGGGAGAAAVMGSVTVNTIANTSQALIQGGSIKASGVQVDARERGDGSDPLNARSSIWSLAGAVSGAGAAAFNVAVAVNTIANTLEATVDGGDVDVGRGNVSVAVAPGADIKSAAVGGGGAGGAAVTGSMTVNTIANRSVAMIKDTTVAAGDVRVQALDRIGGAMDVIGSAGSVIWSVAGAAQGAGAAAIGLASAVNTIANTLAADVIDSDITASGEVDVRTDAGTEIRAGAAGGGGAGAAQVQGSITVNTIANTSRAKVEGGTIKAAGLQVEARERHDANPLSMRSTIWSLAGAVGGAGAAAVNGALATNTIANSLEATLEGASVNVGGDVVVAVAPGAEIRAIAVSGGGAGAAAVTGSATVNTIANRSVATVQDAAINAGNLYVRAVDRIGADGGLFANHAGSSIWSLAGNANGAGAAAVGGASSINTIANTLAADVIDSTVTASDGVTVETDTGTEIVSGAASGGGAGAAAVYGSAAVNTIVNTSRASVRGGTLSAADLSIEAREHLEGQRSTIWTGAGAVGGAGAAAVGLSTAVNTIVNSLEATLTGATVDVDGDISVDVKSGAEIRALAASGGGAGAAAVTGAITANTIANHSIASVSGSFITSSGLYVRASDQMDDGSAGSSIWSLAGNANGAGAAAVGAAAAANTVTNILAATVDNSSLSVSDTTNVKATEHAEIITASIDGGGAGAAAVGGSASVNNIANTVQAGISNSSSDQADNATMVAASDHSSIHSLAGGVRGAGAAGVGAAASINRIGNTIEAYLSGNRGGAYYDARNVVVRAESAADIQTLAAGVAGGGAAGVAGSVATNILDTEVSARMDGGAKVRAQNNVGVLAQNQDQIEVAAGAAGIGLGMIGAAGSVVVNVIDSQTLAFISGAGTDVTALAKDGSDTLTVNSGALLRTPNIGAAPDEDSFAWYDLKGSAKQVSGLAVNALSTQQVGSVVGTVGGSVTGAGIAGTSAVHVLAGATKAYVDGGATVNGSNTGAGAGQDVDIQAASHSYVSSFATGAALGAAGGLGGALTSTTISRTTSAYANNATLAARDAVRLQARTEQGARATGVSLGGGLVGGAGVGVVAVLDGLTEAYLNGSTVNSSRLDVDASSRSGMNLVGGSVSAGAGAIGGALAVAVSDSTTRAYIRGGQVNASGAVGVKADSNTNFWNLAVSGAAGGIGVSGMAAVNVVSNTTEAYLDGARIGTSGAKVGAVTVAADDDVVVRSYGGAAGAGVGAGAGAAANVTVVQSRVVGEVKNNSNVYASGALKVGADSTVDAEHVAASAGLSVGPGLSGSASLILLGNGTTGEAMSELNQGGNGILSKVFGLASGNKVSNADGLDADQKQSLADVYKDESVVASRASLGADAGERLDRLGDTGQSFSQSETDRLNSGSSYDVGKHFGSGADADVTRAAVTGGTIAAGSVEVAATDRSRTSNTAGAAGVGGALGAGGGVAITRVYNDVQAILTASSMNSGNVSVAAKALNGGGDAAHALAFAGGAGPVGLGAAWADAYVENAVIAKLGGTVNSTGTITVAAEDGSSAKAESIGAAVGAGAAGVSVAMAEKASTVNASVANGASVKTLEQLSVLANASGQVYAKAQGAAAGLIVAGTGAGANAKDASTVNALIGMGANVYAGEHLRIEATAKPQTRAEALGVAVGGATGIGASVAVAEAETKVNATLEHGVIAEAGQVTVLARALRSDAGQKTADAEANGSIGGLLFGANATVATANSSSQVRATVEKQALVKSRGKVQVSALNYSEQKAEAVVVSLGGVLALGANIATATSNAVTQSAFNGHLEGQQMVRVYDANSKKYIYVPLAEFQGDTDPTAPLQVFEQSVGGQVQQLVRLYDADLDRDYYVTLEAFNSAHPDPVALLVDPGAVDLEDDAAAPEPDTYQPPVMDFVSQKINIAALGDDNNFARAVAGSGGILAGAAAAANTTTTSTTKAVLHGEGAPGGRTLQAGAVSIDADHTSRFNGVVDSVQAAVAGASGALANHRVNASVTAEVGTGAVIETFDLVVDAAGKVRKEGVSGYNASAASGGVLSGAASGSFSSIVQNTQANIGAGASVNVIGDRLNPGRLDVLAYNSVYARDRTKLDTGGAIAVALAESKVDVTDSKANVTVGVNAVAHSVGDINLVGRTDMDIRAEANAKTYGVAGVAQGYSDALVTASQNVLVKSGAKLRSDGNIRLWAGRSTDHVRNDFNVVARTDVWNKTLLPVVMSQLDARARLNETATVSVDSGAELRSVRDIFLYADEGSVGAQGVAIAKDLYRELAREIDSAMGKAVEEGDLSLHATKGSGTIHGNSSVHVDGLVETGIQNHQHITIDFTDGEMEKVGGQWVYKAGKEAVHTVTSSDGVTYRVYDESLTQNLAKRLDELKKLRSEYSSHPTLLGVYNAEISRIETQLRDLGAHVYEITLPGGVKQTVVDSDIVTRFIEIDHILAAPGDIWVEGRRFTGSGQLVAPGDAEINVTNNTPYFLRLNGLEIPDYKAGRVMLNGDSVTSNAAINRFQDGGASFTRFETAANSPDPSITVLNTYNPHSVGGNDRYLAPDIRVHGDINNMLGTITLSSAAGSVIANANINGKTLNISAGRDFVLGYSEGFYHAGGDPKGLWAGFADKVKNGTYRLSADGKQYSEWGKLDPDCTDLLFPTCPRGWVNFKDIPDFNGSGTTVAGNNVFISARYLNLNGTIQSGIPDWTINLSGLGSKIDSAKNTYRARLQSGNTDPYIEIASFQGGLVKAWWNGELGRIELDGIKVEGGYMELFGEIMNTGGGHLKALDGYGKIDITNTTGYDLVLRTLDVGRGAEGTIKITDLGKTVTRDGKSHHQVTVYKRLGDDLRVYDNRTVDSAGNPTYRARSTAGVRTDSYSPVSGLRYSWVMGQNKTSVEKRRWERKSKTFFDLFPMSWLVPDNYSNYKQRWTWNKDPRPLLEGDYLGRGQGNAKFSHDFESKTIAVGNWKPAGNGNWCSSTFIWCVERTYWSEMIKEDGVKDFNIFGVNASKPITIEFIGYDTGHISAKSNAGLLLNGGIYNPTGATILDGRTIERLSDAAVIVSKDLQLKATDGIGVNRALDLDVSGVLSATSTRGDIGLNGLSGDLTIDRVTTAGDVRLAAQGDLLMAGSSSLIQGRKIDLIARQGGIGTQAQAVNVDTANNDSGLFTASAGTNIYVKETTGDLRLWQVQANGDVHLETTNGSIYDANTNEVRDERAEAELLHLWGEMDLTGEEAIANAEAMVEAHVRGKEAEYQQYWQMRNVHQENGAWVADAYDADFQFRFSAAEADLLKQDMGLDDAGLAALEQQRSEKYHALHAQFGETLTASYDPSFSYALSVAEKADLMEGAVWTENQLKYSISAGIARGTSDTTITIEDPNVIGRNVTLIANGTNSSIGRTLAEDVVIDVNQPLTDAMRLALSTAEKDDIRIEGNLIYVTQREDVDIELRAGADGLPTGSIEARASKEIYLGGELDLNIRDIQSPVVHIKAGKSIIGSQVGGPVIIADDVVLEAGDGSIGSAANPLHVEIANKLARASAASGVYLTQHNRDLHLDYIYGGGNVHLNVLDGSLLAAADGMFGIDAGDLVLTASGGVGTAGNMLKVTLTPDSDKDAVSGLMVNVGGDLFITSPDASLTLNDSQVGGRVLVDGSYDLRFIGDMQSAGNAEYTASGDVILSDGVEVGSSNGGLLIAASDVSMGEGSAIEAEDDVSIRATGDVTVAQITAGRADGTAISIDAGGRILSDGGSDLTATGGGANVLLRAGQGIGSGSQALSVDVAHLDATTANGDIDLHLLADTQVRQILADNGAITVAADGALDYDAIEATGAIDLGVADSLGGANLRSSAAGITVQAKTANLAAVAAHGDVVIDTTSAQTLGTLTTGGNQHLTAGTLLKAGTLAAGGALSIKAESAEIATATVAHGVDIDTAGDQTLGSITSGGEMHLEAGSDLVFTTLSGAESLSVTVAGHLQGGDADFADSAAIAADSAELARLQTGTSVRLTTAGDLEVEALVAGTTLDIDASNAALALAQAGTTADVRTSNNLTLGSLTSEGNQTLLAGGDIDFTSLVSGNDLSGTAIGAIRGGSATAQGDLSLEAGTDLSAEALEAITASMQTHSGQSTTLASVKAATTGSFVSGANFTIDSATTGGSQSYLIGGTLNAGEIVAGSSLDVAAAHAVLGTAEAGSTADLRTTGSQTIGSLVSGGEMHLRAGGDVSYTTLSAGQSLVASVGGHLQGDNADFAISATLDAGSATLQHLQTGTFISVSTEADLAIDEALAGTTLSSRSGGDSQYGRADSVDEMSLHADGLLRADSLNSQTRSIALGTAVEPTGAIDIDSATAALDVVTHSHGDQRLGRVSTGRDQMLNAGGIVDATHLDGRRLQVRTSGLLLDSGIFAETVDIATDGHQQIGELASGGNMQLLSIAGSGGNIVFGSLTAGAPETVGEDEERLTAPSIDIQADGMLAKLAAGSGIATAEGMLTMTAETFDVGSLTSAGADVILDAVVDVVADSARAMRDLKISAGNDMRIGSVEYGGEMSLVAGRNLWAKIGGDISVDDHIQVGGNAELFSGGEITLATLDAGGLVTLDAKGDITLHSVDAGDAITIRSGADINAGSLTSSGGAIDVMAVGDVTLVTSSSAGGQAIVAGGKLRFDEISSGGELALRAGGALLGNHMRAAGDARLNAERMEFATLLAGSNASLDASASLQAARIGAQRALAINAGDIYVELVEANTGIIDSVNDLHLRTVHIGERLALAGQDVAAHIIQHKDSSPLLLSLTGHAGGVADAAELEVTTDSEMQFARLYGKQIQLKTSSGHVTIDDAYVPGKLRMETPVAVVVARNDRLSGDKANITLYELDHQFRLSQQGRHTDTNAYVVRYDRGYTVQVPNFSADHSEGGPVVQAQSALRFTGRTDYSQVSNAVLDLPDIAFLQPPVLLGYLDGFSGIVPVNLTAPVGVSYPVPEYELAPYDFGVEPLLLH